MKTEMKTKTCKKCGRGFVSDDADQDKCAACLKIEQLEAEVELLEAQIARMRYCVTCGNSSDDCIYSKNLIYRKPDMAGCRKWQPKKGGSDD